ncbi:MAG: peptidylprolyl isomerase [Pseudomonadota bacterium]
MRHTFHRLRLFLFCALASVAGATFAQDTLFAPAAIVNDRVISEFDVQERIRVLQFLGATDQANPESALDQLIDEALVQFGAQRQGLALNDEIIAVSLERIAQSNGISVDELLARADQAGLNRESLSQLTGSQLLWREATQRRFAARARPGEPEIEDALLQRAIAPVREVRLSEIAFPTFERGEAGTQQFLRQLYQQFERGARFDALAREFSRSDSAGRGGDLGWTSVEGVPEQFRGIVSVLAVGEISQPFPVPNGVTILTVTDERFQAGSAASRVRVVYVEERFTGATAQDDARAARIDFDACEDFERRQGPVTLPDAPAAYFNALSQLTEGFVSQPVEVPGGFAIVQLCARAVDATPEERNAIADELFGERVAGYAEGFLQTLRREALIERR